MIDPRVTRIPEMATMSSEPSPQPSHRASPSSARPVSAEVKRTLSRVGAQVGTQMGARVGARAGLLRTMTQVLWLAGERFSRDNCLQAAGALTYAGLLAVVPLLTVTFAAFSAFPAFERMRAGAEMLILQNVVPRLGADLDRYLQSFISNAGALTGVGVVGLTFTAILLFFSVERAYSQIWRTANRRPLLLRLLSFWAMLTLAPLLFAASLSASSGLLMQLGVAHANALFMVRKTLPALCEFVVITLSYMMLPRRPVAWGDGLIGGAVAALALECLRVLFHDYFSSASTYSTIYGALSVLPTLLVWMWLVWCIVLFGAELTATLPEWRSALRVDLGPAGLTPTQRLVVALAVLRELMLSGGRGQTVSLRALDRALGLGPATLDSTLEVLERAAWAVRASDGAWTLLRNPYTASVNDLVEDLGLGFRASLDPVGGLDLAWLAQLEELCAALVTERANRLSMPLADLLMAQPTGRGD